MDIFIVRHGEAASSWGQASDPGLSELGQRQAERAAHTLLPRLAPSVSVVSSPLLRAQQTAQPLASALGAKVSLCSDFSEVPAPVPLPERQAWLQGFMAQRWDEQPDSLHLWREQALNHLSSLTAPTVIFSHFLVLNAVVGALQERPEILCYWPDNASITHLRLADGSLELVELGQQMATVVN